MRLSKAALAGHTCGDCGHPIATYKQDPADEGLMKCCAKRPVLWNPVTTPACSRWKPEKKEES